MTRTRVLNHQEVVLLYEMVHLLYLYPFLGSRKGKNLQVDNFCDMLPTQVESTFYAAPRRRNFSDRDSKRQNTSLSSIMGNLPYVKSITERLWICSTSGS